MAAGSSHTILRLRCRAAGLGFSLWGSWGDGGAISHTVAPTTNQTYTATFTTHVLPYDHAGTGGSISPSSGWRTAERLSHYATRTNTTQVSYSFNGWTGTGTGSYSVTNNPASITMSGPITEAAAFTQNPVQVTVQRARRALVLASTAPPIPRRRRFPGRLARATLWLQLLLRAVALGFNTWGGTGVTVGSFPALYPHHQPDLHRELHHPILPDDYPWDRGHRDSYE